MGIRQTINENKKLGLGLGGVLVIIAVGFIGFQVFGSGGSIVDLPGGAFYTDDNGKTFFKDDLYKVVPFDHNGKKAYLADVFECSDGKQFVGLMYRHNALGRKAMADHIASGMKDPDGRFLAGLEIPGLEVKRPGTPDTSWRANDPSMVSAIKCPSGEPAKRVTP